MAMQAMITVKFQNEEFHRTVSVILNGVEDVNDWRVLRAKTAIAAAKQFVEENDCDCSPRLIDEFFEQLDGCNGSTMINIIYIDPVTGNLTTEDLEEI